MRYHHRSLCVGEGMPCHWNSHTLWVTWKMVQPLWKNSMTVFYEVKHDLSTWPNSSSRFLPKRNTNICLQKTVYINAYRSLFITTKKKCKQHRCSLHVKGWVNNSMSAKCTHVLWCIPYDGIPYHGLWFSSTRDRCQMCYTNWKKSHLQGHMLSVSTYVTLWKS